MSDIITMPEDMAANAPAESKDNQNFATNEETVKQVLDLARAYLLRFRGQNARGQKEQDRKDADAMFRMATDQTKQTENKTRDEVDTVPDIYWRVVRAVVSGELDIYYGKEDAPVKFVPFATRDSVLLNEANRICEQRNMLYQYVTELDDRRRKGKDVVWFANKYGDQFVYKQWKKVNIKTRERQPTEWEDGKPTRWEWKEQEQKNAFPSLCTFPIEDVYLDAAISDDQSQSCILMRDYPTLAELRAKQAEGEYVNVGDITKDQLYRGEIQSSEKQDRATNAGTSTDLESETGLFDRWQMLIRLPITEKGKFDTEKTYPTWYFVAFIGNLEQATPVCTRLVEEQYAKYSGGTIPAKMLHTHPDDNGAYHMGFPNLLRPGYKEYKTTLDQWFDNKNLVNAAPWKVEKGALLNNNMNFGARRLFEMAIGKFDKLERVQVPSNTNDMSVFIGYLEQRIKDAANADKLTMGEGLGGRASASEARTVAERGEKPALEKARYFGEQFFIWDATTDAMMWKLFSDPETVIAVTRNDLLTEIKPATLWGDIRVKLVAVDEYQRTSFMRAEQDRFIQVALPIFAPFMGKQGMIATGEFIFKDRSFPVDTMFVKTSEIDAIHVAMSENEGFRNGQWDQPKEGENHEVHNLEHAYFEAQYKNLPAEEQNPDALRLVAAHQIIHDRFIEQEKRGLLAATSAGAAQGAAPGASPETQSPSVSPESAPQFTGEVAGDMMGATEGGIK